MQEFEEYLTDKKINANAFRENEAEIWAEWQQLFSEVHPNSFTQQKLFLINAVRRKYPVNSEETNDITRQPKPKPKFKIPPRPRKEE
jgi:thymidylate synthase